MLGATYKARMVYTCTRVRLWKPLEEHTTEHFAFLLLMKLIKFMIFIISYPIRYVKTTYVITMN